jgi:LmbE family N-acetylglucosaminyl deacetylase
MAPSALAVAAHPDDIELMMAGTLALLGRAGWNLHYLVVANGSCGTATLQREAIIALRAEEARQAAAVLGATLHESLVDDAQIYYTPALVARVAAVVRRVRPEILLAPSPHDYMEDHVNASRLAVSAAFYRGMRNFTTDPPLEPVTGEVAVYHALPWGLKDPLGVAVRPHLVVDIADVLEVKRQALACHRSQKDWLDASQGLGSYLRTMVEMSEAVGRLSGRFRVAEGWQRHNPLGFSGEKFRPLENALGSHVLPL